MHWATIATNVTSGANASASAIKATFWRMWKGTNAGREEVNGISDRMRGDFVLCSDAIASNPYQSSDGLSCFVDAGRSEQSIRKARIWCSQKVWIDQRVNARPQPSQSACHEVCLTPGAS